MRIYRVVSKLSEWGVHRIPEYDDGETKCMLGVPVITTKYNKSLWKHSIHSHLLHVLEILKPIRSKGKAMFRPMLCLKIKAYDYPKLYIFSSTLHDFGGWRVLMFPRPPWISCVAGDLYMLKSSVHEKSLWNTRTLWLMTALDSPKIIISIFSTLKTKN